METRIEPRIFGTNLKHEFVSRILKHEFTRIILFVFLGLFICLSWLRPVSAEGDVNVKLRIEAEDQTVINQTVVLPSTCEVTDSAGATSTFEGYKAICVLETAQAQGILTYQVTNLGAGFSLDSINETANAADGSETWILQVNNATAQTRIDSVVLNDGDELLLTYGPGSTPAPEPPVSVNFNLRYQDNLIFSGQVAIPTSTTIIDSAGLNHFTTASNVLTALIAADATSTEFAITDLTYYESWQNFYLTCIEIGAPTTTAVCDSWHYVVNGVYPSIGMDAYELSGNETVYVYFSNPSQITASTSTFPVNTTTTLKTWRYQYDNLVEPWILDGNNLVDISIPNPNTTGWWDATMPVATTTTNEQGLVDYSFASTGTYYAKVTSVDWSKWSDQITLSVFEITTTTATSSPATDTGGGSAGGGSGGGGAPPANNVSTDEINNAVNKILNFLQSREDANGKIVDAGTTDWAIMSFAANNQYADEVRNGGASLFEYARDHAFDDASTDPNKCATYPRRVLALLAGGVSTEDALIAHQTDKINECHVGASYGLAGINDDIFALIVLLAVGESPQSAIVQDIINTMKQSQTDAGNFTGFSGPDMTGAAINALIYAKVKGANVDQLIINEAKEYLKNEQLEDGSWVSDGSYAPMATSWVVMGINALGEGQSDWVRNNKNPWNVLTENLRANGSYESASSPGEVEWFATKYAVPALLGRSWPIILAPRAIPPPNNIVNNFVGGGAAPIDSATATSTINTSTSTININQTSTTTLDVNTSTVRQIEPENEIETENEATAQEEAPLGFESPVSESGAGGGWLESATARDYLTNEPEGDKIEEAAPVAVVIEELNKEGDEYALQTFSVDTGSVSVKKTAKGFFAVSLAASGGMGLYLALRFLRTIV